MHGINSVCIFLALKIQIITSRYDWNAADLHAEQVHKAPKSEHLKQSCFCSTAISGVSLVICKKKCKGYLSLIPSQLYTPTTTKYKLSVDYTILAYLEIMIGSIQYERETNSHFPVKTYYSTHRPDQTWISTWERIYLFIYLFLLLLLLFF